LPAIETPNVGHNIGNIDNCSLSSHIWHVNFLSAAEK